MSLSLAVLPSAEFYLVCELVVKEDRFKARLRQVQACHISGIVLEAIRQVPFSLRHGLSVRGR